MSNGEVTCLARCCDRYLEARALPYAPCAALSRTLQATKVVSGTVVATYKSAAQAEQGLGGGLQ